MDDIENIKWNASITALLTRAGSRLNQAQRTLESKTLYQDFAPAIAAARGLIDEAERVFDTKTP